MSLHDLTKSQASLLERSVPLLFEVVGKVCSCFNVSDESKGGLFVFDVFFHVGYVFFVEDNFCSEFGEFL